MYLIIVFSFFNTEFIIMSSMIVSQRVEMLRINEHL